MKDFTEFQKLLRKAMGQRSQAEFARNCEISAVQINRFVNNPEAAGRPSIPTLIKIARHASNGVTYAELIKACGYSDAELDFYNEEQENAKGELKDRINLSLEERVEACQKDMLDGFGDLTEMATPWNSLASFVDYALMLCAVEDMCYNLSEERLSTLQLPGKYYSRLTLSWVSGEGSEEVYHTIPAAILFFKTEDGEYIVSNVIFAVNELMLLGIIKGDDFLNEIRNRSIITISRNRCERATIEDYKKSLDKKTFMDFFDGMINPNTQRWYPLLISGYGFEITDGMPNIKEFLKNHKSSFVSNPVEEEILESVVSGETDPYEAYKDYTNDNSSGEGLGALVASIINMETQLDFGFWNEDPDELVNNGLSMEPRSYILLPDEDLWIDKVSCETARETAFKYAAELGLSEYGTCYCRSRESHDRNSVFRIVKDEDTGEFKSEKLTWKEAMERYPANENPNKEIADELLGLSLTLSAYKDKLSVNDDYIILNDIVNEMNDLRKKLEK